jgi:brefeldin A-inhibited guanine nucleotide-exchange protein
MFDTLKTHGGTFNREAWELLSKAVIFSIFDDLKHSSSVTNTMNSKFANKEDMSVWLSTTLIQALGQLVDLLTFYYEGLSFLLGDLLDLLKVCLTHENETLSRIGATCLQKLIQKNCTHLRDDCWEQFTKLFVTLFEETMPYFLFFKYDGAGKPNVNDRPRVYGQVEIYACSNRTTARKKRIPETDIQMRIELIGHSNITRCHL